MTEMMAAAILEEPGRFKISQVPRPTLGSHDVLIKIARVGICGTDMHIFHGNYSAEHLPMILGHEFSGTVSELGDGVTGLFKGTPVVVDMNIGCDRCFWCRRNEILNCPEVQQLGISMDGAFAEYIAVPARLVISAPRDVLTNVLALVEPLSCVVRCARKSNVTFGQSVVVLGAGPIGNLHVQLMRTIGAAPIIVADLSEERVQMALDSGADIGVTDPAKLQGIVLANTGGRGADFVIESVGLPALYKQAFQLIRKGGHVAAFGITGAGETLPLDILKTILEENSIKGSVAGMGQDMHDALTLLVHQRIKTDLFTGVEYPLAQIQAAFDSFADRPGDLKTQIVIGEPKATERETLL